MRRSERTRSSDPSGGSFRVEPPGTGAALLASARPLGPPAALLVLLMAVGSVLLWLAIPVGWLWIASHSRTARSPRSARTCS